MVPQKAENTARNGAFLVLNVGTNTVEFGNSTFVQSFKSLPPNEGEKTREFNGSHTTNSVSISSSTEEGFAGFRNRKKVSKQRDPDWVPEKKVRKNSQSSSRALRSRPPISSRTHPAETTSGTLICSNPSKISPGSGNGTPGTLVSSNSSEISPGSGNATHVQGPGAPPQYLVNLLNYYNWKVEFRPNSGGYVYISPAGHVYCSFTKAHEAFLHGTSRYKERTAIPSQSLEWKVVNGGHRQGVPSLVCGPQNEAPAREIRKRARGAKRTSSLVEVNMESIRQIEEPLPRKQDAAHQDDRLSSQMLDMATVREVNPGVQSCKHKEMLNPGDKGRCLESELNQIGARQDGRRPSQMLDMTMTQEENPVVPSRKHKEISNPGGIGCLESELNQIAAHQDGRRPSKMLDMATPQEVNPVVQSCKFKEMSNPRVKGRCFERELNQISPQKNLTIENGQCDNPDSFRGQTLFRASRSTRICKQNVPMEREMNRMVLPTQSKMKAIGRRGFRRSDRIKGKHVPVDDGSDTPLEDDDDDEHLNQSNGEKFYWQELCTQKQLRDHNTEKNERTMNPRSENCSASVKKQASNGGNPNGKPKKKRRIGGCCLTIRRARKNVHHEEISTPTKICMLSWLIDSGTLIEKEKVTYITKNSTNKVFSGLVTRGGILCECCEEVIQLQKFQAHADNNLHRPWNNIFLQSGKALIECLREAWEKVKEEKGIGFQMVGSDGPDPSDDTCGVCADGGHLICCDGCPSTFHQDCVMLKALPQGNWYCSYCRCAFCMVADRGPGRVHETLALLTCRQCQCKYHLECAWKTGIYEMGEVSYSFCGRNCKQIFEKLSYLLGTSYPIEEGFSWTLLKRLNEDEGATSAERFSLIMECNAKLSMALTVLDECFASLKDQRTGLDMICQAVYNCGSNFKRLNYEGFYTLILEKNEEIISAATLRFHGTKVAEMPFVGTRPVFRMQGMCRRLLKAIENMLSSLSVEKLIIPAILELLETWKTSFSFKHLEPSHKDEIKNLSIVIFPCTTLLQKPIHSSRPTGQEGNLDLSVASRVCFTPKKDATIKPCRVSNSIFAPGLLDSSCTFKEPTDASRESYKMIKDSCFDPPCTLPRDHTMTAFSLPLVNVGRGNDPESSRTFKNTWLQSRDEAMDIQNAAISSSLAFESLLRMRS